MSDVTEHRYLMLLFSYFPDAPDIVYVKTIYGIKRRASVVGSDAASPIRKDVI